MLGLAKCSSPAATSLTVLDFSVNFYFIFFLKLYTSLVYDFSYILLIMARTEFLHTGVYW